MFTLKMKFIIVFVTVVTLTQGQVHYVPHQGLPPADPPEQRASTPTSGLMVQRLDNFDVNNNAAWYMRYIENGQFFSSGGPIFIMQGAEWSIDPSWVQSGQMYQMAQIHNAYMFYTEHRYYGQSYPTKDLSSSNLRYLTTDQALADIANFIIQIKNKNLALQNSKVVVFGGSYGGSLAMWMRQVYPNLVHAAVSSSAPLLAKVDFKEYHNSIQRNLGPQCAAVINRGIQEALRLLNAGYLEKLRQDFNLCWQIDPRNIYDTYYFFSSIANQIGGLIQYATSTTISDLCSKLQNPTWMSDYDRLATYIKNSPDCKGNYNHLVSTMSNISLFNGDSRQWLYQTCTQYGFYQTSWDQSALYWQTIPVQLYNKWCIDFFGSGFTAQVTENGVAYINAKYGNLYPKATRVVSVHGTLDPWSEVGLKSSVNTLTPVIIVNGTSHCADLFGVSSSDPPELYWAKLKVREYISKWLSEP